MGWPISDRGRLKNRTEQNRIQLHLPSRNVNVMITHTSGYLRRELVCLSVCLPIIAPNKTTGKIPWTISTKVGAVQWPWDQRVKGWVIVRDRVRANIMRIYTRMYIVYSTCSLEDAYLTHSCLILILIYILKYSLIQLKDQRQTLHNCASSTGTLPT